MYKICIVWIKIIEICVLFPLTLSKVDGKDHIVGRSFMLGSALTRDSFVD